MPVGDDTYSYRGRLPHLLKRDRSYFVTFCTKRRFVLPPRARDLALQSCIHERRKTCWLHCAVVMPDHIHLLVTPHEEIRLSLIMDAIKGAVGTLH